MIQESKLTLNYRTTNIQNFTTVRKDRHLGQGGGLLTLIHKSINLFRMPDSPDTLADPHLEELTITAKLGNTDLLFSFQDLWKEWGGDSNFQIFSQNYQFTHRQLESLEHFNVIFIYRSHFWTLRMSYYFYKVSSFSYFLVYISIFISQVHFACVLCILRHLTDYLDGRRSQCRLI